MTFLHEGWSYRRKASAFSELAGAGASEWIDVVLPHDAMLAEGRRDDIPDGATTGHFPTGAYQYRRRLLDGEALRGNLVSLLFEGVYQHAAVYVNGTLVGQRPYGYSEFTVRIDPYLRFDGIDEVVVECRTGKDSRWYSGAGLYRPVHLVVKPLVHIDPAVRVTTVTLEADSAVVELVSEIVNDGPTTSRMRVSSEVGRDTGATLAGGESPVTLLPGDRATVRQRLLLADPARWTLEDPALHRARVTLTEETKTEAVDAEEVVFGLRSIQVDPQRGLRINGEPLKLRGACVHHDNGVLGAATFAAAEERRVRLLKEAGFNAIRAAHNPLSRSMLDACDRLGVLVMDEAFDVWTSSKTDEDYSYDFPSWWERDIEAMVAKDINHPSVVLYSIGNEIPETGTPFGGRLSRLLAEKVRSLDSTRLVTNGVNGFVSTLDDVLAAAKDQGAGDGGGGVNTMMAQLGDTMNAIAVSESVTRRTEEAQAVLDVAGMNYAESRYEMDRDLFPNRIILGTESFPTRIAEIWSIVEALPHAIGDFTWTGWDYLGEAGIGGIDYIDPTSDAAPAIARAYPWLIAFSGDIDITGHRRPASYYREIVFGLRADPYIAVRRPDRHGQDIAFATPWAWSDSVSSWSWRGQEDRPVHVEVYARADVVALLLDGEELDRRPVGADKAFRADFETTYRPGTLEAVAFTDGEEIGRHRLVSAGAERRISVEQEHADRSDLVFAELTVTDAAGVVATGEDVRFTVSIEGPAVLQGFGSARPQTEESFQSGSYTTYDGRAFAVVRLTGDGPVTLAAVGEGLPALRATLVD